jgi:DNA invertase Pin-like site-specific DNA recombinase
MNPEQIAARHRSRSAYVYIRQSSQHQVLHHHESQRRQRSLVDRALALGWTRDFVVEIDEDLGRSAARSRERSGFSKMVAAAALGKVGLILALEVSRLIRGNRDWYHLLDICAVTGTLIADAEGLYDPRAYNDRLLLGLKGTMSEAELHVMKQRLAEAVRAKARRGEFRLRLPPGYVWDEAGRIVKTPDAQVRSAVALVFERFAQLGTVHQVQASLAEEGLLVPTLGGSGHQLRWAQPGYGYLHRMLRNPMYAGAYVFGKRQVEEVLDDSQRPVKRVRERPRKEWHVLLRDHHESYLSWEAFEKNQRQITANRRGGSGAGAPREGASLLAGLVLCGHCGRRMKVSYGNGGRLVRYACVSRRQQTGAAVCQSFGALRLERAAERLLLEALAPLGIEAMLEAAKAHLEAGAAERAHWRHRVERARYEVGLARKQYDAVDPANRLVAGELERRWEEALRELERIEGEAEVRIQALEKPLTAKEQERLRAYAGDLPRLWSAPGTRPQDKKRIVRCLIENVVVTVPEEGAQLKAEVCWVGGEKTAVELPKGKTGIHRHITDPELVELIRTLAQEFSDEQIARILSRRKLKTSKGLPFTARRVTSLRGNYGIEGRTRARLQGGDVYTAEQAAEILGVCHSTVIRWIETGLLHGSQLTSGAPWRVRVTEEDKRQLAAADAPEGWLPLKGAAQVLGVSQQTVLQRLKSGRLEGVRVRVGRRSGWRIRVAQTGGDDREDQPSLLEGL